MEPLMMETRVGVVQSGGWVTRCVALVMASAFLGAGLGAEEIAGWAQAVWGPAGRSIVHAPSASFALEDGEVWHASADVDVALTTFVGLVEMPEEDRYRFLVEIEGGAVSIRVDGGESPYATQLVAGRELVSTWVPLPDDDVRITLTFHRHGTGRARMRTLWERSEDLGRFPRGPLLAHEVRVPDEYVADIEADLLARRGRVLLESKGCVSCHEPGHGDWQPIVAQPLGEARHWVRDWTERQELVHRRLGLQVMRASHAHAIVAGKLTASERHPDLLAEGRGLFESVGCVACHGPFEKTMQGEGDESLHPLYPTRDWTYAALGEALSEDGSHVPLGLSEDERFAIIAAFVNVFEGGPSPQDARSDPTLFVDAGCAACHPNARGETQRPDVTAVIDFDSADGCLSTGEHAEPHYDLTADERAAITAALASASSWTPHTSPHESLERTLARNDCLACHTRHDRGGPSAELRALFTTVGEDVDLGDEGRLPPDLSDVGSRLTTHALRGVLVEGHRARPWMSTRMPFYGDEVDGLAELFTRGAGFWPDADEPWPSVDDDAVLAGRELAGAAGMNCITCHLFGDRPAAGTPGLHLDGMAERLRYEWFTNWMHDPQRMRPGTRMPAFGEAGESAIDSLYEGRFHDQVDALWAYLSLGEFAPVPKGLETPAGVVLDVGERPRIVRTFLDDAGSRGIAVGYPVGVHVGYDAGAARFVSAWEGAFLDASGAWAARGGNVSGGRGPTLWEADDGPALIVTTSDSEPDNAALNAWTASRRFAGYRLDANGVPTFFTEGAGGPRIGERLVPDVGAQRLRREWTFPEGLEHASRVWLRRDGDWQPIELARARAGLTMEVLW